MREKKKPLKLRKFKIASLHASWLKGGTNSNPCQHTGNTGSQQSEPTIFTCNTDEYTCPAACGTDPTRTKAITQPGNPCSDACAVNGIDLTHNGSQNTGVNC
ncbi:hypothetical protein [uncultured Kordia sp.]|uniref:hypothetical protein n=1 Tax=uncultured Kordia sp. TaxID=507699 RepID=UPI00260AD002|nr:hypothetical protein [uncultured Kordia sp.]